jgi:hypothetical protein
MLDVTGKKLLGLLLPDYTPEIRAASARVIGELGLRDDELVETLCAALDDPDESVRLEVLKTIGLLHIDRALPQLLSRVQQGGIEAEAAAQAAARLGAKGTRALQHLMGEVAPGLRRRIAAALGVGGTPSASTAAIDVLLDNDPGVVDAAVRSLIGEVSSLSESQRRSLAGHILELVRPKKGARPPVASEAALIRLMAALADPRCEAVFWERIKLSDSPDLRAAALQALGTLPAPRDKQKLKLLLDCAVDADFRIAAPAMMILRPAKVGKKDLKDWLPLLDAPDVAVRRFALEKLADWDDAGVSEALLRQLDHADRGLAEESLRRLRSSDHGRKLLAQKLLNAQTPDDAWALARAQVSFARDHPLALRPKLLSKAFSYLEGGDRRADALLFLLREANGAELRDRLEERGLNLRKKKSYSAALTYFRLLARDPACAEATRFELAACGLKLSERDLAVEARTSDPALQQFARLIHSHDVAPEERLKKAKWLEPADLFYLGFHFAESDRAEKQFGAHALRLLIERAPRSKLAKDAKSKLRNAALD